jgi:hypothetical protein
MTGAEPVTGSLALYSSVGPFVTGWMGGTGAVSFGTDGIGGNGGEIGAGGAGAAGALAWSLTGGGRTRKRNGRGPATGK